MAEPTERLPNSHGQRARLAAIVAGQAGHLAHCVTTAVDITGPLRVDVLRQALDRVVATRPALRGVFSPAVPYHEIAPARPVPLVHRVLSESTPARRWQAAHDAAAQESRQPFAVGATPLLRALLLTAEPRRHLLVISADPLAADAWSANLIQDDLVRHALAGTRPVGPPTDDAYPAVRRNRARWEQGPAGEVALARRRARLAGSTDRLPWNAPAADADDQGNDALTEQSVDLPDAVVLRLRERIRAAAGSTLAAGLAGVVAALPCEPTRPVTVTSTFAARTPGAEQQVVGWLSTDVAVVLPAPRGQVDDYLRALRSEIFDVLGDQWLPLDRLRDAGQPVPDGGVSVSLLYLPSQLSGGAQTTAQRGPVSGQRSAVSVCPTGADIDLFLLEAPPPRADGSRPLIRLGAICTRSRAGMAQTLLNRWHDALVALADLDWRRSSMTQWRAMVATAAVRPVAVGAARL